MKIYINYILIIFLTIGFVACKSHKSVTTSTHTKDDKKNTPTKNTSLKKKYADILGVSESDIKNEKLYQFINEWYGTPYKYGGKDKHGIDCSGMTSVLYNAVYQKTISSSTKALVNEVKKIKTSDLKEGDLVFFNTNGKSISHVGVYLQNNKFVHASTKRGVMISNLSEPYYVKTYVSAGRVK